MSVSAFILYCVRLQELVLDEAESDEYYAETFGTLIDEDIHVENIYIDGETVRGEGYVERMYILERGKLAEMMRELTKRIDLCNDIGRTRII